MSKVVRIGTRESTLALIQIQLAAEELKQTYLELEIEAITKDASGDRILDRSLQEFSGKGVLVSGLEQTIKAGTIDLIIHSAKDLPMELTPGPCVAAVPHHEDPRDVLVTMKGVVETGKETTGIGTSSPRRQLEAMENHEILWPGSKGMQCGTLRGNVHTWLRCLEKGSFNGIILAAASLERLNLLGHGGYGFRFLRSDLSISASGQGLMAAEVREGSEVAVLCRTMDHREGRLYLTLEKAALQLLDAGCHEPVGIFSRSSEERMEAWGASRKGSTTKRAYLKGGITSREIRQTAEQAGKELG